MSAASGGRGGGDSRTDVDAGTPNALLRPAEVAERLGVPKSWVYAECRAGRLPHVRLGRYVRVREAALEAWLIALEAGSLKGPWRRYADALPGSEPGGSPHG